ncbi:hypothetical protein CEXT_292131 [Caerostris extrusa]|uniref:Uncharacterized protein n=1 Tax=Caerostris extrusa TaxID=172846 RepID=A0AAV4SRQ1_CAEEX|nr:hypothetical protein CEXT_292131 [Caerostris extrusa]
MHHARCVHGWRTDGKGGADTLHFSSPPSAEWQLQGRASQPSPLPRDSSATKNALRDAIKSDVSGLFAETGIEIKAEERVRKCPMGD